MASIASRRPGPRPLAPGPSGVAAVPPRRGLGLSQTAPAAALPLILVGVVIAWWAWKDGAYFGVVFLPGVMILLGLLVALLLFAPWPASLQGGARVSLFALFTLAGWTLLSGLWSPTPAVAISDAQHILGYATAFVLGIWLCLLLGRRMLLALAPIAVAGAVVAVVTLFALWLGNHPADFFEEDATLRYPLGYRNAEAAFFVIALWPMLVLAASRDLDWRVRGALLGTATIAIELAVLSQSRGSAFAAVFGAAALIAVHPARLRILGWMTLALIPAAIALPWLLDVYEVAGGNTEASIPPLHTACAAIALTGGFSFLLGLAAARADPSIRLSEPTARAIGRVLLAVLGVILAIGVIGLLRADGGPTGFFSRHADQLTAGTPDLTSQGSRFGFDLRSNRGELWRVGLDEFADNPVAGDGAGAFRFRYLRDRNPTSVQPEDPHSVELLMGAELGIPGLLLFVAFVGGAIGAVLRARRLGPSAAALAAGALGLGAYWLVHASVEWFWSYPAITLPVCFAIGTAIAPALLRPAQPPRRGPRIALAIGAGVAAIWMLPYLFSERYTNDALRNGAADPDRAYAELQDAADLNPASDRPLAALAVIAESAGDRQRALAALGEGEKRVPDEWTLYYLEARVLAPIDPAGASRALAQAKSLNPDSPEIQALAEDLGIAL